jgi:hypothetical protein
MSDLEYGIGHGKDGKSSIVWCTSRESAGKVMAQLRGERVLVARTVGETYIVRDLPTTPGSVIRAVLRGDTDPRLLMRFEHPNWEWVGPNQTAYGEPGFARASNAWPTFEIESWELVFDAAVTA